MGIIRAAMQAVSGGLADQWLEVYEPGDMEDRTVFTTGVKVRKGQNVKGSSDTVSNGSVIHVYDAGGWGQNCGLRGGARLL